ncbi:MAG: 30S ribosomal protein S12 methylthiotransferase RimO [Deltaproteobacteria bacterium]|nr:MAG: 30S ribosomal protein S12 methylthiotransferase RimO [Deltaproteobacteria bacterium]
MPRIYFVSLGCVKNLVDSEYILGLIKEEGYDITDDPLDAEIAIVNTCAFITSAVEEGIGTILDLARLKEKGHLQSLFVVGCLVQRYGRKLPGEIPEVDGWLGTGQIYRTPEALKAQANSPPVLFLDRPRFLADHRAPRLQTTPFYSAYLKIAEGCSHPCSYCIIPSLRGPFRSRTVESLFIEAQNMVARGVKEINLVAQDTSWYGHDLDPPSPLEDLLEKLLTISGLKWLRILYAHPYHLTERLFELIDSEEVLCPYLDLPIQHINPEILRAMGRSSGSESIPQLIERIRRRSRKVALRTTVMIGFPGETEDRFRELLNFIREAKFDRLGAFPFSPEKGTPAARLKNGIPEQVVKRRIDEIMEIQAENSTELNKDLVGKTVPVLVEGFHPETDLLLIGRTATMAPEVDGQVLINRGTAAVGEIVPVQITEAHTYDLVGSIERGG